MKCEYCGKEHDGSYGSGRFCNIVCKNRFNYIKARKQFIINLRERERLKHEDEGNSECICELCKKHYLLKEGFTKRFCSKFCSRSFSSNTNREETNRKISMKLRTIPDRYCKNCGISIGKRSITGLCKNCIIEKRISEKYNKVLSGIESNKTSYLDYRRSCKFKFAINEFPNEFDIDLIRKFGWYSAKNHGNNLNGVSRDHMYSVNEGYKNGIDPKIISHPANCKLMQHNDNVSKGDKSSISLEELLKRIEEWDLKYNK